ERAGGGGRGGGGNGERRPSGKVHVQPETVKGGAGKAPGGDLAFGGGRAPAAPARRWETPCKRHIRCAGHVRCAAQRPRWRARNDEGSDGDRAAVTVTLPGNWINRPSRPELKVSRITSRASATHESPYRSDQGHRDRWTAPHCARCLCQPGVSPAGDSVPVAVVVRVAEPPALDGDVLNDEIWSAAVPVTEFWQTTLDDGEPASERKEVRIVYTARMDATGRHGTLHPVQRHAWAQRYRLAIRRAQPRREVQPAHRAVRLV